jgi:hypothetical protein
MRKVKDRRAVKRISYICEVECEGAGMNRFATRINDLSTAGAFIDSITAASPGSMLRLKFRIKDVVVETTAEVRYSIPQVGMGVRFLNLRPQHLHALRCLVDGTPIEPAFPFNEQPGATDHPPASQNLLLGNFAVINIFDVIQIIENSQVTGALLISLPSADGAIRFNQGRIVDAATGDKIGPDALSMFLDANEGTFEFKKAAAPFDSTIDAASNMGLILDLLRLKDEQALDSLPS